MKNKGEHYRDLIEVLAERLPSTSRANNVRYLEVARALGISTQGIRHRLANPSVIKNEHVLAAEKLLERVVVLNNTDLALEQMQSAAMQARKRVLDSMAAMH
jgi:hypothetical protein